LLLLLEGVVTAFLLLAALLEFDCIGEVTGVDELLLLFTILFAALVACSGEVETRVRSILPLFIIGEVALGMGVLTIVGAPASTVEA